ncbi:InlB B-repeat-containing protein [Treponema endosymbiont of Eucomonympha sp.]|uniref:InlB B-repeat-containing protein n=1 Tax=Treponema endosymbiont of Eucomonympha sp. TaxID=1580831 RepID=UPI000A72964B|nr:InlB B-repeat-containing protein [Treponema endosymbiont of Eucomonympha sp.]
MKRKWQSLCISALALTTFVLLCGCDEVTIMYSVDNYLLSSMTEKVEIGKLVTVKTLPNDFAVAANNIFAGWQKGSGEPLLQGGATFLATEDVILFAKWKQREQISAPDTSVVLFTVTLDGKAIQVTDDKFVLEVPENREGFMFLNWIDALSNEFKVGDKITSEITLQSVWRETSSQKFILGFDANEGDSRAPQAVESSEGAEIALPGGETSMQKNNARFAGWNTQKNGSGKKYGIGSKLIMPKANVTLFAQWSELDSRTFHAKKASGEWYDVQAVLAATRVHVLVYADAAENLSLEKANELADKCESTYQKLVPAFGGIEDVDGNGKIIVLFLDIKDDYETLFDTKKRDHPYHDSFVRGQFDATHMTAKAYDNRSNEADMIFIDTKPGFDEMNEVYLTIAREIEHLISYTKHRGSQETWLNESLAMAAEFVAEGQQQKWINYFNKDESSSIRKGNNFFCWEGTYETLYSYQDRRANYATAYLFMQWLRIHANSGIGIYKEIMQSSFDDYRAVVEAANKEIPLPDAQKMTGWTWESLLRTWLLANALHQNTDLYGYKAEIQLERDIFVQHLNPGAPLMLSSGEGVFSQISSGKAMPAAESPNASKEEDRFFDDSGKGIRYVGISKDGQKLDMYGTFTHYADTGVKEYVGDILLTFNADTDNKARQQKAYIAK